MRLSSTQELDAPIDFVFWYLADFETHIATAAGYGAEVERIGSDSEMTEGTKWAAQARIRGKDRHFDVTLAKFKPTQGLDFDIISNNAQIDLSMRLTPLGPSKTQVKLITQSRAKSIAAKILLQSAKLAKSSINRRFDLRVRDLMGRIEDEYSETV